VISFRTSEDIGKRQNEEVSKNVTIAKYYYYSTHVPQVSFQV